MKPFFFGDSNQALYGVYQAADMNARREGIVLCAPFGQEYMRAHRAMRQLSMLLCRQGYDVLRFDYRGTGDSSGDLEDQQPENWLHDIRIAVEELKDTAGADKVSLVGLRLGALLAAAVANQDVPIDRLVLWDPVSSGQDYINELRAEIDATSEPASNFVDQDGCLHFNGFPMSRNFQTQLQGMDLAAVIPTDVNATLEVVSHETDEFRCIKTAMSGRANFSYRHITAPGDWNYVDSFGGILLPQPIIQGIVNWFG